MNQSTTPLTNKTQIRKMSGFSLTEVLTVTAITGILSSIAIPQYFDQIQQSNNKQVQTKVASIPTIISAYIDATGELPTKWDELSSIAAVMTNDGPATGELTSPIILPNGNFEINKLSLPWSQ